MAESLTSKVGRILSGGFHALVDAVEASTPETTLEQAVREVDLAIDDVRAELGRELARQHLAKRRLAQIQSDHASLTEQLEVALHEAREDLAEAAIAKQLDLEAQTPVLEQTLSECGKQQRELEGFVTALQAKRRQMRDELRSFREAQRVSLAAATANAGASAAPTNGVDSAERRVSHASAAFERVLERVGGVPANPRPDTSAKLGELEELARAHRVKERLELAKARIAEK